MGWATVWIGYFYLLTFVIGFGAISFVLTNPQFLDAKGGLLGGGTQAQLDALNRFLTSNPRQVPVDASLSAIESILIQYTVQMTLDVKVSDAVFAELRQHFNTTEIVELTSAIATYNMVARFLVALGVSPVA